MPTRTVSWAAVEEKLAMDFTIWKSKAAPQSRPEEHSDLVERSWLKKTDRGVATILMGTLEWNLIPPSGYTGYCERQEEWLLVSRSGFRVTLRSPHGSGVLQVCPASAETEGLQLSQLEGGGVDMSVVSRFFTFGEVTPTAMPTLRRTVSLKKRAEIVGMKFDAPFLNCVNSLRNAKGIADVLDAILGFSIVYLTNQHVLQPTAEEFDYDDIYLYDMEGLEELRSFNIDRRKSYAWVRQQTRDAATKCQVAAETTSEAAKLGARMFHSSLDPAFEGEEESQDPMETDKCLEFNTSSGFRMASPEGSITGSYLNLENERMSAPPVDSSSDECLEFNTSSGFLMASPEGSITGPYLNLEDERMSAPPEDLSSEKRESNISGFSLDDLIQFDSWEDRIDGSTGELIQAGSGGRQSDVGMETSSTSSWEFVRGAKCSDVEEEDDILGAGISDAESLNAMLRERDPFGCNDCSYLVNEFLSLSLNCAVSSTSTGQEQSVDGNESRKSTVLKRLASWSSSNSGWSTSTDREGPSSVSKKMHPLQLETLAEEPACDADTASVSRSFVMRAAVEGGVLQWCSCNFNKSRCSIELRFQVGSFMEDDIATLSTGISRASPLRVEIFLDTTNPRESLLEGKVRISTDQGAPKWPNEDVPSVIGLSCYIPHLVRSYLQQVVREQADNKYEFPDGSLLTGLMQHVVSALVFLKSSCCVCNQQRLPDMITSVVPKPCDQNLCQALHDLWLVVAPRMVLEACTVETWLRHCCFQEGLKSDEDLMLHYMGDSEQSNAWTRLSSYDRKLEKVMRWIESSVVAGSWLELVSENKYKTEQEHQFTSDIRDFPRRIDAEVSFETSLKAWQARYQRGRPPSRLGMYLVVGVGPIDSTGPVIPFMEDFE